MTAFRTKHRSVNLSRFKIYVVTPEKRADRSDPNINVWLLGMRAALENAKRIANVADVDMYVHEFDYDDAAFLYTGRTVGIIRGGA